MNTNIIGWEDLILVTGATGFIGSKVVESLLDIGFRNLRCFARPTSSVARVEALSRPREGARVELLKGNLLSREDCIAATKDVAVIFHLAAGIGADSFPDAYMNSVVTTRNLLEASLRGHWLGRFVNISSFLVYTNTEKPRWRLLDESCPVEKHPELGDASCFAKVSLCRCAAVRRSAFDRSSRSHRWLELPGRDAARSRRAFWRASNSSMPPRPSCGSMVTGCFRMWR